MDFEFTLEEVRRKVGAVILTPILLFGDTDYWKEKITTRFQSNLKSGMIKGSEWISNCFYNVKNAKEAIKIYKKNQTKIDIVVLDMIMPGMGGGETYDMLKQINPNIKVILSSGYSVEGQASEIIKRGCNGFIQKPFHMKKLSKKITEVMEKK